MASAPLDDLTAQKQEQEALHGAWTAHNVRLDEGTYTISDAPQGDEVKLQRVLQTTVDLAHKPVSELRVLDLACLEGMYSLEFAARGARVTAIEGREQNLAKARFAAGALGLEVDWIQGDVRSLSREKHGEFDVVLCLGILYHLDADDVFSLVRQMHDVCTDLTIIDTHVASAPELSRTDGDRTYWGAQLFEHDAAATPDQRLKAVWSSLDNPWAFAPTRSSLFNLLGDSGFSSVFECLLPPEPKKPADRITLVARAGERLAPEVTPLLPAWDRLPETEGRGGFQRQAQLVRGLPAPMKARMRELLGLDVPPRR